MAEARAVEERRRRKLQAGLAAAVLALVGFGGAGAWVLAHQRADRIAATTRLVNDALGKAADLRGRALAAPPGELAGWDQALVQTRRAEDALAQGLADEALRGRVASARAELERLRAETERCAKDAEAERRLADRLTRIRIVSGLDQYDPRGALRESVVSAPRVRCGHRGPRPRAGRRRPGRPAGDRRDRRGPGRAHPDAGGDLPVPDFDPPGVGCRQPHLRAAPRGGPGHGPRPWRDGLRALLARPRAEWTAALKRLVADHDSLDRQSAHGLQLLAGMLNQVGERALAGEVYQAAWRRAPDDFWHNWTLGMASWEDDVGLTRPTEALRFLSVAVALRPDNYRARLNLGNALRGAGDRAQAIAVFRELIRRYPRENAAYIALADTLRDQGTLAEAEAAVRAALRQEQVFRRKYDLVWAHRLLALILKEQEKSAEAEAEFREAIRLDPRDAEAHNALAAGLLEWGDLAGAARSNREALRLWPELGVARATRAKLLVVRGRFAEAVPDLERAAARLAAAGDRRGSAACRDLLAQARRLAGHADALRALAVPDERDGKELTALDLAARARAGNRPALAAGLYQVVLAVSPGRAGDLQAGHRLVAARPRPGPAAATARTTRARQRRARRVADAGARVAPGRPGRLGPAPRRGRPEGPGGGRAGPPVLADRSRSRRPPRSRCAGEAPRGGADDVSPALGRRRCAAGPGRPALSRPDRGPPGHRGRAAPRPGLPMPYPEWRVRITAGSTGPGRAPRMTRSRLCASGWEKTKERGRCLVALA